MKRLAFKAAPLLAALVLAGCASISPDGLRGDVARHTEGRLPAGAQLPSPDAQALQDAQTQIADWLKTPVDADTAVLASGDGGFTWSYTVPFNDGLFPNGETLFTYTATDPSGRSWSSLPGKS